MSIKVRLIIMNFLQFFVWGSWLISLGGYMGRELHLKEDKSEPFSPPWDCLFGNARYYRYYCR